MGRYEPGPQAFLRPPGSVLAMQCFDRHSIALIGKPFFVGTIVKAGSNALAERLSCFHGVFTCRTGNDGTAKSHFGPLLEDALNLSAELFGGFREPHPTSPLSGCDPLRRT